MRKFWAVALFLILCLLVAPLVLRVSAQENKSVVLGKTEVVNKDYFAAGGDVTISGTVNGDVYAAGGNVLVDGVVNGDLLVAGGTVTINGRVSDDIRAAGGTITIDGTVGKNVTVTGGSINITNSATIMGGVVSSGGTIQIFAPINKSLYAAGGKLTLGSQVKGDVWAGVGALTVTPEARIGGNVNYSSQEEAIIAPEASIAGQVVYDPTPKTQADRMDEVADGVMNTFRLASFITALLFGLLLLRFLPRYTQKTADVVRQHWIKSLTIGLVATIVVPVLAVLLLITVIGIPFALILLFVLLLALYLGKLFVALTIGQVLTKLLKQDTNRYITFILGLVIYYVVTALPGLGSIVTSLVAMMGLGALLLVKKEFYQQLKEKKQI